MEEKKTYTKPEMEVVEYMYCSASLLCLSGEASCPDNIDVE